MRTKHLLLFFAVLVTGGFTALNTVTSDGDQDFASSKIATEKNESVMAQKTADLFQVDPAQLQDIRNELKIAVGNQSGGNLNWLQKGPINVGGRTRAILIDQDNPHILYAGSVAGGVYKSETNGQYWTPVETDFNASVLSVTSMAQDEDGAVYYTTGDVFDSLLITKQGVSSFAGAGLFKKSSSSDVFEHVTSTDPTANDAFFGVTEIAIYSKTQMYLSTWKGLYFTNDEGGSWARVESVPATHVSDVQVNTDGVVITATGGKVYKGSVGDNFTVISGTAEDQILEGGRRYEFSFAPTDPNYLYAIAATQNDSIPDGEDTIFYRGGKLLGIFNSTDAGETWEEIGIGGSSEFAVLERDFDNQAGIGSMMIQVDDQDPEYVYVGGVDLWAGYKPQGVAQFQWNRKTYNSFSKVSPLYLTANIHVMAQHPNNDKAYIGCDGGIYRFEEGMGTVALNNYYSTGLFFGLSFGPNGEYLAGAQDNGVFYNDFSGPGSQELFAREIMDEDDAGAYENGMNTYVTQLSPRLIFFNHGAQGLRRSLDYGENISSFWSKLMKKQISGWDVPHSYSYDVWETNNYEITYDVNNQKFYDTVPADTTITILSQNIFGAPIEYYVKDMILPDSILPYHDPYKAFFAVGIESSVWLTTEATSRDFLDSLDWVPPFVGTRYYDTITDPASVAINNVKISEDGANLYFTMLSYLDNDQTKTEIFRMDSLHVLLDTGLFVPIGGRIYPTNDMYDNLQKLGEISNTEITSLTLDPNNPERLIITTADYNYTDKVFYCANANTATSDVFATNFVSVQGDLPKIPVFDGCINVITSTDKPNHLLLGTEIGVWTTDDYTAGSPSWTYNSNGDVGMLNAVPVMQIKQQTSNPANFPLVDNYGILYVATWGNGIFVDSSYYVENAKVTETDDNKSFVSTNAVSIEVYPNPVQDEFKVKFNLANDGNATLRVFDLSGKILKQEYMGSYAAGSHVYEVNSSDFEMGIYFVEISNGTETDALRIIKR